MKTQQILILLMCSMSIALAGCTDSKVKAINELCIGLENIKDSAQRSAQYMQCRKACGDAEIYNMPEGDKKKELMKTCVDAGQTGDTKFQKSSERNWLGVMP